MVGESVTSGCSGGPGENEEGWGFIFLRSGGRMAGLRLVLVPGSKLCSDERVAEVPDEGAGIEGLKTTDRSISR